VLDSKQRNRSDPKTAVDYSLKGTKMRATGGSGTRKARKTAPKTATIGGNKAIDQLNQQLHFEEGADVDNTEELVAAALADNTELRQQNKKLQQQNERSLIEPHLGSALSTPNSDRKQYGAAAGLRLLEELQQGEGGGEQRRTRRVQSSLSTKNEFKERWLRQLGADLIEHVAIAAKGNGAKVVQLMDYGNDRPEMLKPRGEGWQAGRCGGGGHGKHALLPCAAAEALPFKRGRSDRPSATWRWRAPLERTLAPGHPSFCRRVTLFRVESTRMAFIACCGITCTIQSFFREKRHRLLAACLPSKPPFQQHH
jgi:hypothetical protein